MEALNTLFIDIDDSTWVDPVLPCKAVVITIQKEASVKKRSLIFRYFLRLQKYKSLVGKVHIKTTESIRTIMKKYEVFCPVEIEYEVMRGVD